MIHIRKLVLAMIVTSLGSTLYGMEKEQLSLLVLPQEIRRHIASLLLEKTLGYNYERFRKIDIKSPVDSVAFSPDSKTILTGSFDGTVRLWDIESGERLKLFKVKNFVNSLAFSPDGKTVLTGFHDNTATVWDIGTGKQLKQFVGHTKAVKSVAFSPNGKKVLTGSEDFTARLWDRESEKQIQIFEHAGYFDSPAWSVNSVTFSSDGNTILTGSSDGKARLWDVHTGRYLKVFEDNRFFTRICSVNSVAFSPDGKTILTGDNSSAATLWDRESGKKLKSFSLCVKQKELFLSASLYQVLSVAFSPDGRTVLIGSWANEAQLWDIESGEQLKEFTEHNTEPVYSVVFSKDGELIATASKDGSVIIYKRSKESEEETKERFKQRKQTIEKEFQEKIKFLLNPVGNRNEEVDIEADAPKECIIQ